MTNNMVVLAYSGGLDTSFCAVYLSRVRNLEVHAVMVNTGGFTDDEVKAMEARALSLGAASFHCIQATEQFYQSCIRYLIFGNVLKNNTYPLSVSAERITQATAIAQYAQQTGAAYVAHGSTGAGNDQVRFDMAFHVLIPGVEILTPIRDMQLARADEVAFLKEHGVDIHFEKAVYSVNQGLWGTSVGGRETLRSDTWLPESAFPSQLTKQEPEQVTLTFTKGELTAVNGASFDSPVQAITHLQSLAAPFAIGRDVHVGDTIIGIKGRVGFEAAAPLIILKAHHLLEKHVLTKWQLYWKDQMSAWYGNWLHEGQFMDPVMRDIEAFFESTQQNVNGMAFVTLAPYRFTVTGIQSPHDLMSDTFGSYGETNKAWSAQDVKGFSKIFSNGLSIYHQVNNAARSTNTD